MHWFRLPRLTAADEWEEGLDLAELFEVEPDRVPVAA